MKAGWEFKKLGEICTVIAGQSPEGKFYNASGNGLPFYQGKKEFTEKYIGRPTTWTTFVTKEAIKDDVLMSVRAPVGPINFSTEKICIGRGLAAIRASDLIDKNFLFNFLLKHETEIVGNIGAVFDSINKNQIENILIPTPPIPEQKRIVAILDQAFESIAKARANAEQNLKNAQSINMSVTEKLFSDLGNSAKPVELRTFIEVLTDYHANGSYETLKQHVELKESEDYAWMVRSTDFENNFKNDKRYIDKHAYDYLTKSCIFGGEIIMSKIGNAGKVYLMPEITRPCSLAMNLFLIRLNAKLSSKFVYYFLKSSNGASQIKSRLQGAATQTITKENVRNILIPVSSQEQQAEIVSKIDSLSIETQRLEALYQRKIELLDELKKSLLQQAFAGEL